MSLKTTCLDVIGKGIIHVKEFGKQTVCLREVAARLGFSHSTFYWDRERLARKTRRQVRALCSIDLWRLSFELLNHMWGEGARGPSNNAFVIGPKVSPRAV
jgi:hypothetical protein